MALTKEEIISTAFRVWGASMYRKTSLQELAGELGVTKPALYAHFKDKDSILVAMADSVLDKIADCVKKSLAQNEDKNYTDRTIESIKALARYFAACRDDFLWTIMQMHGSKNSEFSMKIQLNKRGIDFGFLKRRGTEYPSAVELMFATFFYMMIEFHKQRCGQEFFAPPPLPPSEAVISILADNIENRLRHGLNFDKNEIEALEWEKLEDKALKVSRQFKKSAEDDRVLSAAAAAVAEAGPWKVSMTDVAKKAGLSKSSLYGHFKNKEDMMRELLYSEFDRILNCATSCGAIDGTVTEQLYLSIVGVAFYFKLKPDILIMMDKLKTRGNEWKDTSDMGKKYDFAEKVPKMFVRGFEHIQSNLCLNQWILFLVVDVLTRRPENLSYSDISNESFRTLFKFIALGTGDIL